VSVETLTTSRLVLRQPTVDDAEQVLLFRGDPVVQRFSDRTLSSVAEAKELLVDIRPRVAAGSLRAWVIVLEGSVIGMIGLHTWVPKHRRAELGFDLARVHWGRGYASEAARAVLSYGFTTMQLHRIEAYTMVENLRSARLLERLGFTREGVCRAYVVEDDEATYDSAVYGLLASDV
jgi:ribosomal-protein-alanine N-acetyltransferase